MDWYHLKAVTERELLSVPDQLHIRRMDPEDKLLQIERGPHPGNSVIGSGLGPCHADDQKRDQELQPMFSWQGKYCRNLSFTRQQPVWHRHDGFSPFSQHSTGTSRCSSAQQDQLLADLNAVAVAHQGAVRQGAQTDQAQVWQWWQLWQQSVRIDNNPFLRSFAMANKHQLRGDWPWLCTMDGSLMFSIPWLKAQLTTLCPMWHRFWDHGKQNPTKDEDSNSGQLLQCLYQGSKNSNPCKKQQNVL